MITALLIFSIVLVAGVLVVNMLRPRFTKAVVSAAVFFKDLPPSRETKSRLRLSNPARSRPMIFQVLMLAALVAALFFHRSAMRGMGGEGIALWILMDTSASMDAATGPGEKRMDLAVRAARRSIEHAVKVAEGKPVRIRLSAFDLERTDLVDTQSPAAALSVLDQLKCRPLGTDISLVSAAAGLATGKKSGEDESPFTHLQVITDQAPKPIRAKGFRLIWSNVAKPADNRGIADIQPSRRDPITGLIQEVTVTCEYFGAKAKAQLEILDPSGTTVADTNLTWKLNHKASVPFPVSKPGLYTVSLKHEKGSADAYAWDDRAEFLVGETKQVTADWQLSEEELLRKINWKQSAKKPDIRVVPFRGTTSRSTLPTLYVENRPTPATPKASPIQVFENHPLNHALDFDAFDELHVPMRSLPSGFRPVLAGGDLNAGWMAYREKPGPAVYLSQLPNFSTNRVDVISRILFVNSVRWLLGLNGQTRQPLYELTSPAQPNPKGNVLALHPGEGDTTAASTASLGSLKDMQRATLPAGQIPVWPALLAICAVALAMERILAAFGGAKWR